MLIQVRVTKHCDCIKQYLVEFSEFRAFLDYIRSTYLSIRATSLERDKMPDFNDRAFRLLSPHENFLPESDLYVLINLAGDYFWKIHVYEKSVIMRDFAESPTYNHLRHVFKYNLSDETVHTKYTVTYKIYGSSARLCLIPDHIEFALLDREQLRAMSAIEKTTIRKAKYAKRVKSV